MHQAMRAKAPLVHNITNYVVMTISANVLLAAGASPAMVHAVEEAEEFLGISSALVANIGTLSPRWVEAMEACGAAASKAGKPWVLDPVGCGATAYRTEVATRLAALKPTLIRGNASEIMALAGASGAAPKGVDSTVGSDAALDAARALSLATGSIVAVTGETDYATDGARIIAVTGGDPMMPLSTGLGCSLSALCGAFLAAGEDPLAATVAALAVYGAAGAAAAAASDGPGDLPAKLCNALHASTAGMLAAHVLITEGS
ncbi:hydroxyethylthiazole kinase [Breoghania sp. L-A4]|nr:hydroxyethylthiazole kinase [Breoghania sp. L-A4]